MKRLILAALVAASCLTVPAFEASAQPRVVVVDHRDHRMMHRHRHQVCEWRHHHRVCTWR